MNWNFLFSLFFPFAFLQASVLYPTQKNIQKLFLESLCKGHIPTLQSYLDRGAGVNGSDTYVVEVVTREGEKGWQVEETVPLFFASSLVLQNIIDQKVIEFLLEKGADVNHQCFSQDNKAVLHLAASCGDEKLVNLFLKRGADVNIKDEYDNTPLHLAAEKGYKDVIEILLNHGAEKTTFNEEGHSPFHLGSAYKEVAMLLWEESFPLCFEGGKICEQCQRHLHVKQTLLLFETIKNRSKTVEDVLLCLEEGALVNARDENSLTPLHLACLLNRGDIAKALLSKKACIKSIDDIGNTPLHYAAAHVGGNEELVKLLVEKGARIDIKNRLGTVPSGFARTEGFSRSEGGNYLKRKERVITLKRWFPFFMKASGIFLGAGASLYGAKKLYHFLQERKKTLEKEGKKFRLCEELRHLFVCSKQIIKTLPERLKNFLSRIFSGEAKQ